mmetsp:Transcript_15333/g.13062  ORF Transcript_15333/g.13062 Transcript_15333/m.13062 type:complete len:165 (+) Transcript_15333:755-1249(+)
MQPDQKAELVTLLRKQNKNDIIGMCGDGANDCIAMKAANVGVSLSEAEASIAAPFTSKKQDIECIVELLKEGKSALNTSIQCFKYMALYSLVQFFGITIMYTDLFDFTNWHYYHLDILGVFPFSTAMALSATRGELTYHRPISKLISANVLASVIGQGAIQLFF